MRKSKSMRMASGLLVITMLSTCMISGTFARYTTQDNAKDNARVAKWGVTVEASGNLFGTDYETNTASSNKDSIVAATSANVSSSNNDNVVAPGTKNDVGFKVQINGTPEVAYEITATNNDVTAKDIFLKAGDWGVMVEATGLNAASDVVGMYTETGGNYTKVTSGSWVSGTKYYKLIDRVEVAADYYPINWKVVASGNATTIATTKNLTDISASMLPGIEVGTHNAKSNSAASYTLTWEWPIDGNDGADTILGDLMAGSLVNGKVVYSSNNTASVAEDSYSSASVADYNLDVAFGMKVTVTQVD